MGKERKRCTTPGAVIEAVLFSVGIYVLLTAVQAMMVVKGLLKETTFNLGAFVLYGLLAAWCGGMWGNYKAQNRKPCVGIISAVGMLLCLTVLGVGIWGNTTVIGEGIGIALGVIAGGIISTVSCRKKRRRGKRIKK